jgi:lipopolysaccharide/colanic/teichoic acid biosynthesis glycosyltransferase
MFRSDYDHQRQHAIMDQSSSATSTAAVTVDVIDAAGRQRMRNRFEQFAPVAILAAGDAAIIEGAVRLATLLRDRLGIWLPISLDARVVFELHVLTVLLPLGFALAGLYPGYGQSGVERLRLRVLVIARVFGAILMYDYLVQDGRWSRGITLISAAISLTALPLWDDLARRALLRLRLWGCPVAVLGDDPDRRRQIVRALSRTPELGWIPVLVGPLPVPEAPAVPGIEIAVIAMSDGFRPPLTDTLSYRRVVLVPAFDGEQSLWVKVRDLGVHLGLETRRNLLLPANQVFKRLFDLLLASLLLLLATLPIAVYAVVLMLISPGPIFFSQMRRGIGGRPFLMHKLRSMTVDADRKLADLLERDPDARAEWDRHMKLHRDPRIVPVIGRIARRFSLDELPQLWNVIRGDMSLIGPRPLPDYHLDLIDPAANRLRERVRPGLTGLWQVSGRSTRSLEEMQALDSYYVRNWSFWLDIYILVQTLAEVAKGDGAW